MKWLITGGCGFIGSRLVRRVKEREDVIRVVDNFSSSAAVSPEGVHIAPCDVRDIERFKDWLDDIDIVVHLAAQTDVVKSILDPTETFSINTEGVHKLLIACTAANVERFIFASSVGAGRLNSPYGASKLTGEAYCEAFRQCYDLSTLSLRFSNVYGPGSNHKTSVVAKFIKAALAGETITIHGNGSHLRDYVYVDDIVETIIEEAISDHTGVENVASGDLCSINTLITALGDLGLDFKVEYDADAFTGGSVSKLSSSINYGGTDLLEGLEETLKYFRGLEK